MAKKLTLDFLKTEAGSGAVLGLAAIAALIVANSPLSADYFAWLKSVHVLQVGPLRLEETISGWIKEGLMAVFFLVVGLEIKYEILKGELSNPKKLALPIIAAVGGMAVPGLSIWPSPGCWAGRGRAGPFLWPPTSPSPWPSSPWWARACPVRCGSSC